MSVSDLFIPVSPFSSSIQKTLRIVTSCVDFLDRNRRQKRPPDSYFMGTFRNRKHVREVNVCQEHARLGRLCVNVAILATLCSQALWAQTTGLPLPLASYPDDAKYETVLPPEPSTQADQEDLRSAIRSDPELAAVVREEAEMMTCFAQLSRHPTPSIHSRNVTCRFERSLKSTHREIVNRFPSLFISMVSSKSVGSSLHVP